MTTEIVASVEGFAHHHKAIAYGGGALAVLVVLLWLRGRSRRATAQSASAAGAVSTLPVGVSYSAPMGGGGYSQGGNTAEGLPMPPAPASGSLDMSALLAMIGSVIPKASATPAPAPTPAPYTPDAGTAAQGIVEGLYAADLNRSADSGGLQFWATKLLSGSSVNDIKAGIEGSAEYATLHPSASASSTPPAPAPASAPAPAPAPAPVAVAPAPAPVAAPAPAPAMAPYVPPSGWGNGTYITDNNFSGG